jgi:septin 7
MPLSPLQIVWVFRVQDTPGYGDDQDISKHIDMIVHHINAQNTKWLEMENAKDRYAGQRSGQLMGHAS